MGPTTLRVGAPFMEPLTRYVEPASAYIPLGWHVVSSVYERLVETERGGSGDFEPVASLATGWERSDDGLVYSFVLRTDARFAGGAPVTAEAVRFSLERVLSVGEPPSRYLPLREVRVTGTHSLDILLERPAVTLLAALASPVGSIVDPASVRLGDDHGHEWLIYQSAGSGPFRVEEMSDTTAVLEADPSCWRGAPRLQRVVLVDRPDPEEQRLALERGEVDLSMSVAPRDFYDLIDCPGFVGHRAPSFGCPHVSVLPGTTGPDGRPLTTNTGFLGALKHALDYDSYAALYGGWGDGVEPCQTGVLTGMPGFDSKLASYYRHDPALARELLARAGYPGGIELEFPYWEGYWGGVDSLQIAGKVESDLRRAGIVTRPRRMSSTRYFDEPTGSLKGITISMSAYQFPDPDDVLRRKMTWASSGFESGAEATFDRAAAEVDPEARAALYAGLQCQFLDAAPAIFLLTFPNNVVRGRGITGYGYPLTWSGPSYHRMAKE